VRASDFPAYPEERDERSWALYVGALAADDDNLFRVSDLAEPPVPGIDQRGDRFLVLTGGANANLHFKRQAISFDLHADDYSFETFSQLDDLMYRGDVAWDWVLGSRLQGAIGYAQSKDYPDFSELQFASSDTVTYRYAHGSLNWRVMQRLAIRGLAEESKYDHEDPTRAELNNRVNAGTLGVFYVNRNNAYFGVQQKVSDGLYPNRQTVGTATVDNRYRETESSIVVLKPFNERIGVEVRVGHTERRHEEVPERDFDGPTGRVQVHYAITPKVLLDFSLYDELQAVEDLTASYAVVRGASIAPAWAPTIKWRVQAGYSYNWRVLDGNPGFVLTDTTPREDRIRAARVVIDYQPNRHVATSLSFERGNRTSNVATADYEYSLALFKLTLSL
jgi:exopolysaccharide biosynthesis operon protein EpsL